MKVKDAMHKGVDWVSPDTGAPKGTPNELIDKLNNEINAGLADPKLKARIADFGGTVFCAVAGRLRQIHRRRNR